MSTTPQWNADIVTPTDNVDVAENGGLSVNEDGAVSVKVDGDTIVINQDGELQATLSDRGSAYVATYGTTTYQELSDAHTAGKAIFVTEVSGVLSAVIPMTSFSSNPAMVMFSAVIGSSEYRAKIDQDVWSVSSVSLQADWNESNQLAPSYIANKPTVDQVYGASSTNAQSGTAVAGAIAGVRQVPSTQSSDNGKVLGVTDGNGTLGWVSQPADELPSISGKGGKVLKVNSGATAVEWADDENTTYTFSTGLTESSGTVTVTTPVPSASSADNGKVLGVTDSNGTLGWVSQPSVPATKSLVAGANISITEGSTDVTIAATDTTYTAGNCISVTNNAVAWETTAGITDIQQVAALPASPVATVLYLIPET